MINAFSYKYIYSKNVYDQSNEPEFEESIAETTKMRRQKSDEENQQGQGLKILTPQQMLSGLPISLAQLRSGNNSQDLKNEIRQLLHSLYRSKKLSKTIYKNLMDAIYKWKQYEHFE